MSSSNCCFLTGIQISEEAGQVVWYSHLSHNFPQFIVIHTVKGFGIVNKAEIDVFFSGTLLLFSIIQQMLAIWSLVSLLLRSSWFTYCSSLVWRILSITLLACEMMQLCGSLNILWHCPSLRLEWKLTFSSSVATAEFSKFGSWNQLLKICNCLKPCSISFPGAQHASFSTLNSPQWVLKVGTCSSTGFSLHRGSQEALLLLFFHWQMLLASVNL